MLQRIKLNLEAVEAMLYYWQAASEKENISEVFFNDVSEMKALKIAYEEDFDGESVRRALSAIKNREPFTGNKKERKFWNNNMWMMEDLEYTQSMATPIKQLNIDGLLPELQKINNKNDYEEVEVIFSPLHSEEYIIVRNCLIINFFRVRPSDFDERTFIGEKEVNEYILEKLTELLTK